MESFFYEIKNKNDTDIISSVLATLLIFAIGLGVTEECNARLSPENIECKAINTQNISLDNISNQPTLQTVIEDEHTYYCVKTESSSNTYNLKKYDIQNTKIVYVDDLESPYIEQGYRKYKNQWLYLIAYYHGTYAKLANDYIYVMYVPSNTQFKPYG